MGAERPRNAVQAADLSARHLVGRPERTGGTAGTDTLGLVATKLRLEPDLAATVERARKRAADFGELTSGQGAPSQLRIPPEVGVVVGRLLRDGTYAQAVARVVADDPDLADS